MCVCDVACAVAGAGADAYRIARHPAADPVLLRTRRVRSGWAGVLREREREPASHELAAAATATAMATSAATAA